MPISLAATNFLAGFNISEYDAIELTYSGGDLHTVVYKRSGNTVATLTLTYTDGNLTGVAKT